MIISLLGTNDAQELNPINPNDALISIGVYGVRLVFHNLIDEVEENR